MAGEIIPHGFGPAPAQILIIIRCAEAVGVAANLDRRLRRLGQHRNQPVQCGPAPRRQAGLIGIELDLAAGQHVIQSRLQRRGRRSRRGNRHMIFQLEAE
jgi:hypothetical protein